MALLAGCSESIEEKHDRIIEENRLTPEEMPREEPPPADNAALPYVAPLTGLGLQQEAVKRPIAVMINNYSAARPQSGLPHADMVWEVLAEGGITRLVAIFQSDEFTDSIGPIRSIRPYLISLGESFGAVLTHAGGSPDGYAILQRQKKDYLDEITNAGSYFWREKFRKAPHNLYSNLEKLRAGAAKKKYAETTAIPTYPFSEEGATGSGTVATNVEINFLLKNYKVSYVYDAAQNLYARSINDKPHTDLTTEKQLTTTNIAVLGASHKVYDDVGRLDIDLESGGSAILIQRGRAVDCTWERGGDGVIRLMKDGKELPLVPGKTFYHIVPNKPTFAEHVKLS
ncbi:DUF3048 domain-containing protein [Paenibacillus oenotherae]|uniref:DUF3048 domain-containing protein n=2 Tax=Paenibacillus oenotherae TaxID=1435645 RepID=A0ABS7D4K8_9BACL|nr:DUF3048 domain-containing protein [Paenibacillus oenotherae]